MRSVPAPLSIWARPPFLELLVTNCVTLAEDCLRPRTKRILRLLAADLALEAEKCRAIDATDAAAFRREPSITSLLANESAAIEVGSASAEHAAV